MGAQPLDLEPQARVSFEPVLRQVATILPATERRRSTEMIGWALNVAQEAITDAKLDPMLTSTVFSSSDGDGKIVNRICAALADPSPALSPIDFHNSVHNAPAGYWAIGTRAPVPSISIAAWNATFAMGLLEAAAQAASENRPVLLIAYDLPQPPPLHACHFFEHGFATAIALGPAMTQAESTRLRISIDDHEPSGFSSFLSHFESNPAAAGLPLLTALASGGHERVWLRYRDHYSCGVEVFPS